MWRYLLLLLAGASAGALAFSSEPRTTTKNTTDTQPEERWLNVRLNHMMADNTDSFPMRFFFNRMSNSTENIVIVVGGDWEISPAWASGGLAAELADNLQGSLFYTEHRYYGLSRPGNDTNMSVLRFLTTDQALGDLAQFIQHVKSDDFESGQYRSGQVVLVGCGAGGRLATWMRLAYPHLVQAVVADSSPLHAREELPEFLEIVLEALRVRGIDLCASSVLQAVEELQEALDSPTGLTQVSQTFDTCAPLSSSPMDLATLWATVTTALAELVVDHAEDIPAACETLTDPAVDSPMQRLAKWLSSAREDACLESRYTVVTAALSETGLDSPVMSTRLWLYQACSQFGWLPTSDAVFPGVPVEFYHQLCKDVFTDFFDPTYVRDAISRTNLMFAGLSYAPDHVVSVSSTLDPWLAVGRNATHATPKAPVYVLQDGLRCTALGSLPDDPPAELVQLKINIWNDVQTFITGQAFAAAPRALCSTLLLAVAAAAAALLAV